MRMRTRIYCLQNITNNMEEKRLQQCGFISLNCEEMQVRGGISFSTLRKIAAIIGLIVHFAQDYAEDFKKGYKNGYGGQPFLKVV